MTWGSDIKPTEGQLDIFGNAVPAARATDPQTSHDAATSAPHGKALTMAQAAVWRVLLRYGPCTDEQLAKHYTRLTDGDSFPRQSPSGLRTRRRELANAGRVADAGERAKMDSGRTAIVWVAVTTTEHHGSEEG